MECKPSCGVQGERSDHTIDTSLISLDLHPADGLVIITLAWGLIAASLWATFRTIGVEDIGLIEYGPQYIAAVSLSMVAGFLSLIPAGLGVRDLVLVELIVKLFAVNDATATVAGGLLRLIWLVSEVVICGILYFMKTKQ